MEAADIFLAARGRLGAPRPAHACPGARGTEHGDHSAPPADPCASPKLHLTRSRAENPVSSEVCHRAPALASCRDALPAEAHPRRCRALTRSRRALVLENLALRQQLATAAARRSPAAAAPSRSPLLGGAADLWPDWSSALAIVKPATVVAWHRRAFRSYWRRLSRKPGRPPFDAKLRELIERMVRGKSVGSTAHPRRTSEARVPGLRADGVALCSRRSTATTTGHVLEDLPRQPPRGAGGHGLLRRAHGDLPAPLRSARHPARSAQGSPPQCDGAPNGGLGNPATARGIPVRDEAAVLLLDRDSIFSAEVCHALRACKFSPYGPHTRVPGRTAWPSAGSVPVGGNCSIT